MGVFGPYLSEKARQSLKHYNYIPGEFGWLESDVLPIFWDWLTEKCPRWLAPNLITLIGLCVHLSGTAVILYYGTMGMTGVVPGWACSYAGVAFFIYVTLDGVDGKQARRTGSSSPLGQLFDHGCDAIASQATALYLIVLMGVAGERLWALVVMWNCAIPFFLTNWEENHTRVMRFGAIGVTEAEHLIMVGLLLQGCYGADLYNGAAPYPLQDYQWRHLLIVVGSLAGANQVGSSLLTVRKWYQNPKNPGSTTDAQWQLASFAYFVVLSTLWVLSPTPLVLATPLLLYSTLASLFCYQTCQLIVCIVTRVSYAKLFPIMMLLPLVVLNSYSSLWTSRGSPLVPEVPLCTFYLILSLIAFMDYISSVVSEICEMLNIRCFFIPYPGSKDTKAT